MIVLTTLLSLASMDGVAQQVKGRVLDTRQEPVVGAAVMVQRLGTGTVTDFDGCYALTVRGGLNESDTLVFSCLGYKSVREVWNGREVIDVTLESESYDLDEIVVVGYGSAKKVNLTGAVDMATAEVFGNRPMPSIARGLQGVIPNLNLTMFDGNPSRSPEYNVRGTTSIGAGGSALVLIDGVEGDPSKLNPNDIESVSVLKDAASAAIYGARASNGVVIVTTKSGKAGRIQATYSYNFTVSEPGAKYDLASGREYIELNRKSMVYASRYNSNAMSRLNSALGFGTGNDLTNSTAFTTQYLTEENKHKLDEGWESMPDPLDPSKTIIFKDTDFQDLIYRTAYSHSHNLTVSGGDERASFYAGLGYLSSEGTAITTEYKRLSFSLNGSLKLRDNLKVTGRMMYTTSNNNEVYDLAQIFYRAATLPPTAKFTYEDGTLAPGQNRSIGNPVYHLNNDKRKNSKDNLALSMSAEWEIVPGLKFVPQLSLYKYITDGRTFTPAYWNGSSTYNTTREATGTYNKTLQQQMD